MLADNNKVRDLIPQKEPFVMVDELISYAEETLKSNFKIKAENIFVENNQLVESGVIEHMAQSVALHTGYQFYLLNKKAPTGYIGSIKNIIIYRLPRINESIQSKIEIIQEFMGVTLVDIEVFCKEELIATCQMKTVIAN